MFIEWPMYAQRRTGYINSLVRVRKGHGTVSSTKQTMVILIIISLNRHQSWPQWRSWMNVSWHSRPFGIWPQTLCLLWSSLRLLSLCLDLLESVLLSFLAILLFPSGKPPCPNSHSWLLASSQRTRSRDEAHEQDLSQQWVKHLSFDALVCARIYTWPVRSNEMQWDFFLGFLGKTRCFSVEKCEICHGSFVVMKSLSGMRSVTEGTRRGDTVKTFFEPCLPLLFHVIETVDAFYL